MPPEEAETERQFIEGENKAKEKYRQSLDNDIADKERQLRDERKAKVDSILDSVSSLSGWANPQQSKRKTPS